MSGHGNLSVASNGEDAAIGGVQDDASSAAPAPSQAAAGHGLRRLAAPAHARSGAGGRRPRRHLGTQNVLVHVRWLRTT